MLKDYQLFIKEQEKFKEQAISLYHNSCLENGTDIKPIFSIRFESDNVFICTDPEELDGVDIPVVDLVDYCEKNVVEEGGECVCCG